MNINIKDALSYKSVFITLYKILATSPKNLVLLRQNFTDYLTQVLFQLTYKMSFMAAIY